MILLLNYLVNCSSVTILPMVMHAVLEREGDSSAPPLNVIATTALN